MVLILWVKNLKADAKALVSVPLRGLWFLSFAKRNDYTNLIVLFPSPCGDYGSYQ